MGKLIKMQRDYKPTYKFGWMKKGETYDVDNLPIDEAKANGLVKSGYAEEVNGASIISSLDINKKVSIDNNKKSEKSEPSNDEIIAKVRADAKVRRESKKDEVIKQEKDVTVESLVFENKKDDLIVMATEKGLSENNDLATLTKKDLAKLILGE